MPKQKKNEKPENPAYQTIEVEVEKEHQRMDPKQFMLWGMMGSLILLFTGIMVAYLIHWVDEDWLSFGLPTWFYMSTTLILLSSFSFHWAIQYTREDDLEKIKQWMALTVFLGIGFMLTQYLGWRTLFSEGSDFQAATSYAFLYVLSGIHALHVLVGIIINLILLVRVHGFKIHSKAMTGINRGALYWHFVDGLWLYVFIFLLIFR